MIGLVDNLKQRKAALMSPLAFILAACGGGGSSIVSNISDSDSTGSTGDNTGGTPSSTPTTSYASKGSLQSTTSSSIAIIFKLLNFEPSNSVFFLTTAYTSKPCSTNSATTALPT